MRVAILFDNFGPYHLARLKAASESCELLAVEFGISSSEYAWDTGETEGFQRVAIHQTGPSEQMSTRDFSRRLHRILNDYQPEVVFIPGWASRGALLSLSWCTRHKVPAVVMSESTPWDERRILPKEWIKKNIVSLFSVGLVGGSAHQTYLEQLGMSRERIYHGYDTVDNCYFKSESDKVKANQDSARNALGLPKNYFLASARFIKKKNLHRLLKAYKRYRAKSESRIPHAKVIPWDLVILGDGALRGELEALKSTLGLQEYIHMPGFKQYHEIPAYYARAGVFIHASTTEQWGLVVNEAMASGLPVIVSNRCGCALDLVREGVNGWTFNPNEEERLVDLMIEIASDEAMRLKMGEKSLEIIDGWGTKKFANGVSLASYTALRETNRNKSMTANIVLNAMHAMW